MNPQTFSRLPATILAYFGPRSLRDALRSYDNNPAIAHHLIGAEIRNHIRPNTHRWTDQQLDQQTLPLIRAALRLTGPQEPTQ